MKQKIVHLLQLAAALCLTLALLDFNAFGQGGMEVKGREVDGPVPPVLPEMGKVQTFTLGNGGKIVNELSGLCLSKDGDFLWGVEGMGNSGIEGIAWYKGDLLLGAQTGATLFHYTLDGKLKSKKSLRDVTSTISEIAGLDYDEEKDWLWVIDSNSNKKKPQYLPYTIYLFEGAGTRLLATYSIGSFAHRNPEAICVDKRRGCIWVGEDCGDGKPSLLHKVTFSFCRP